jgi:ParB-like chromosome segregation protein Spo0J
VNIQALIDAKNESLDKPLLVSADGFVLDGHHRWAANARLGRQQACRVIHLPAAEALAEMEAFAARHPDLCAAKA